MLTEQQRNEMLEAAKPLIKWLNDNCHPHCSVHVDQDSAQLLEAQCLVMTGEFLKD